MRVEFNEISWLYIYRENDILHCSCKNVSTEQIEKAKELFILTENKQP